MVLTMKNINCLTDIKKRLPSLHKVEKKIAGFILSQPENVIHMSVSEIAKTIGVASSSVIRFCQIIGFQGLKQLKINLARNLHHENLPMEQAINADDSPYTITSKVFTSSIFALQDTLEILDKKSIDRAVATLVKAKKIEFYGIGSSAPIAMDAYYRFMRIGLPAYAATDPHIARISASKMNRKDVAIGISHTGRTCDTYQALKIAKKQNATTICITSFLDNPILDISDIKFVITSSETRLNKEAVSSRIAHIALLDSLCACIISNQGETSLTHTKKMEILLEQTRY